jgi:hypothetical protein
LWNYTIFRKGTEVNRVQRTIFLVALVVMGLAIPTVALANKQVYRAALSWENELHEVVGSTARGAAVINHNPDGTFSFQLQVRNLSGPVTGIHIHGAATPEENAGVVVTWCGGPAPAAAGPCPAVVDGTITLFGTFSGSHVQGVTGGQFINMLTNNLTYVNVHTSLNPAGEARGQLIRQ